MNHFLTTVFLTVIINANAADIVAHRGASGEAPENTLSAISLAWKLGADAIEVDVHLTADKRVVCMHDMSTGRTGGVEMVIKDSNLKELRLLEYGSWKDGSFKGEPIPMLEEVLALVPEGKRIYIEIKCGLEILPDLTEVIRDSGLMPDQIRFIAFNPEVISNTKKAFPDMKCFWLTCLSKQDDGTHSPSVEDILEKLDSMQVDGLDCEAEKGVIDAMFVKRVKSAGYEFHVWTVNDAGMAKELSAIGIDSITTDYPDRIR